VRIEKVVGESLSRGTSLAFSFAIAFADIVVTFPFAIAFATIAVAFSFTIAFASIAVTLSLSNVDSALSFSFTSLNVERALSFSFTNVDRSFSFPFTRVAGLALRSHLRTLGSHLRTLGSHLRTHAKISFPHTFTTFAFCGSTFATFTPFAFSGSAFASFTRVMVAALSSYWHGYSSLSFSLAFPRRNRPFATPRAKVPNTTGLVPSFSTHHSSSKLRADPCPLGNRPRGGKANLGTISAITQSVHLRRRSKVSLLLGILRLASRKRQRSHGALCVLPLKVRKPWTETPSTGSLSGSTHRRQDRNDEQPEKPLHLRRTV